VKQYGVKFANLHQRKDGSGSFVALRLIDLTNWGEVEVISDQVEAAGWRGATVWADLKLTEAPRPDGQKYNTYRVRCLSLALVGNSSETLPLVPGPVSRIA
jgi:hypothetical protein